jgi:hypothetical protein
MNDSSVGNFRTINFLGKYNKNYLENRRKVP